jgi:hypothetical protein
MIVKILLEDIFHFVTEDKLKKSHCFIKKKNNNNQIVFSLLCHIKIYKKRNEIYNDNDSNVILMSCSK